MKLLQWTIAAVAALLLAGCVSNQELGQATKEITEQESDLVFNGPGLEGGYRQIIFGYVGGYYTRRTLAFYGPQQGEFPHANMVLLETSESDRYFPKETMEEAIQGWTRYTDNPPRLGETVTASNKLGAVDFATFQDAGANCLVFSQVFGVRMARGARNLVTGYCCRLGSGPISEAEGREIVAMVGHRDYGAVPLAVAAPEQQDKAPEYAGLSGDYLFNWSDLAPLKQQQMVFVGNEQGSISFKSDILGYCDGSFSFYPSKLDKDDSIGEWTLICGSEIANGKLFAGDPNKLGKKVRGEGTDASGRNVSFAK